MSCADAIAGQRASFASLRRERIDARLDALALHNAERRDMVERLFREAGCGGALEPQAIAKSSLPNVICRLPGRSPRVIVVGAHYDKVEKGQGAADNWSGAALLPSLYESLRSSQREHSYEFVAFSDEEKGLVGSRGYLEQLSLEQRGRIAAMINLDTLGLDLLNVDPVASSPRLYCLFASAAGSLGVPLRRVDVERVGTSDYLPFHDAGIEVASLHSLTQKGLPVLHSAKDRLEAIDRDAYFQSYRTVALYLALLDLALDRPAPPTPETAPPGAPAPGSGPAGD
jgi:Zn-dependent M28 family amino/carboxypeptidase